MTPRRSSASLGVWVVTFMPFSTGVVHEAGIALAALDLDQAEPARAERLELSVAHSFGMPTPASTAARITDVPSGTVTGMPSIVSVTVRSETRAGVP